MRRLQDQDLEHEHMVEGRAPALASIGAWHRTHQIRPEDLEIHNGVQTLEIIALRRQFLQPLVNIEEPALATHPMPPDSTENRESQHAPNCEVLGGVQLADRQRSRFSASIATRYATRYS